MTSTTKSAPVRQFGGTAASALFGAAAAAGKGSAGLGLVLAKQGYALAQRENQRRRARFAQRAVDAERRVPAAPRVTVRNRRIFVFGTLALAAGGVVLYLSRRRNEVPPPADAPPSLADYDDTPS